MSSIDEKQAWNVFDGVKIVSASPTETLMAEINSAIAALEYARAPVFSQSPRHENILPYSEYSEYDVGVADEAYKAGMASMVSGKVNEAVVSLNAALSKCPPHKTSAVAKLHSLLSLKSSQHLLKSSN